MFFSIPQIKILRLILLFVIASVFTSSYAVPNNYINKNQGKYAIGGYDPVSYFKIGKAVRGVPKYSYKWRKAIWLFASKKNLQDFKKGPYKYAPQYGGYCAYAVSRGYVARIDPKNSWTIYKNKLYLNYNKKVQQIWKYKKKRYINRADRKWPKALKGKRPNPY